MTYVAAQPPDLMMVVLLLVGLWCLTSCLLLGLALVRRARDAPRSVSLWIAALAGTAALPGWMVVAAATSYSALVPYESVVGTGVTLVVGLTVVSLALRVVEARSGALARVAPRGRRRRLHPGWAAALGLALGATVLLLDGAVDPYAEVPPLRVLSWLVGAPAVLAFVQTVRRAARDAQIALEQQEDAGAQSPAPPSTWRATGLAVERLAADVRSRPDAAVPCELATTLLAHAAAVAAATLGVAALLTVGAVLASRWDPVGLAIMLALTAGATCGVALAVAPWALTGTRTAWRLRGEGPEPAAEPDPA